MERQTIGIVDCACAKINEVEVLDTGATASMLDGTLSPVLIDADYEEEEGTLYVQVDGFWEPVNSDTLLKIVHINNDHYEFVVNAGGGVSTIDIGVGGYVVNGSETFRSLCDASAAAKACTANTVTIPIEHACTCDNPQALGYFVAEAELILKRHFLSSEIERLFLNPKDAIASISSRLPSEESFDGSAAKRVGHLLDYVGACTDGFLEPAAQGKVLLGRSVYTREMLSVKEAADKLHASVQWVYKKVKCGELDGYKVDGKLMLFSTMVDSMLEEEDEF